MFLVFVFDASGGNKYDTPNVVENHSSSYVREENADYCELTSTKKGSDKYIGPIQGPIRILLRSAYSPLGYESCLYFVIIFTAPDL